MATYTFDKIEYNSNTYVVQDSGALQLTGGQVTGPVTFGNTISVDEATIGDLVVNGAASFTNNIQANTINGVTVGNSPKFTDTPMTVTTTGSGNAVTAVSASGTTITVTKGATYSNNAGTITGVTAGTGLSGGGTSSSVTLNHSNSVTAQTTQAVYPIKIDAQGHISAYGSAVTIPDVSGKIDTAGSGLSKSGTTLNHSNSVTAQTTQAVYPIKIDAQGHISAYGSAVTIPTDTNTWRKVQLDGTDKLGTAISTNPLNLKAGTNMSITESGGTFTFTATDTDTKVTSSANHYTPSTASGNDKTASASGATAAWSIDVVKGITINTDGKGHITGLSVTSGKIPANPNTDTKLQVAEVTSETTYYPIVGTGTTAATRQYDTTGFKYFNKNGTTSVTGQALITLGNSTAKGTANNKKGSVVLYGETAYSHELTGFGSGPTAARYIYLPDETGTIALTSDVATEAITSGSYYYVALATSTTATKKQIDTTGLQYRAVNGTTSAVGSSILTLGNNIASGTANNKQAQLIMYGSNTKKATITLAAPSADIALALPTSSGTLALTSDIPTSLPASDVYSWAKASSKPSYTASEVGALASNTTYVSTVTTTAGAHTAISSKSGAVSFNVPTKTSHLTNDSNFVTSSGVTSVATGAGLTGGTITGTGTLKANLNSETSLGTIGTTDKLYAVGVDSNGKLCVNVPWSDTTYTNLKLGQGYGTCSTASATAAKTVTCSGYQLVTGGIIGILFSSGATSIYTLNINSTGAKAVKYRATTATSSAPINPTIGTNYLAYFMYDGTNYVLLNWQHTTATTSLNGYMSSDDKTKLNGIATGATANSITLNGSANASPSFYAPTGAGTSGNYLKSNGSGAPTWASFPTIPSITLNGSSTTSPSFYAPTSVGTSGYYLKSNGSGAPTWTAFPTIPTKTSDLTNDSNFLTGELTFDTVTIAANGSSDITLANAEQVFIVGIGAGNSKIVAVANCTTTGSVTSLKIGGGSSMSVSNGTNKVTVTNGYGYSMNTLIIRFAF